MPGGNSRRIVGLSVFLSVYAAIHAYIVLRLAVQSGLAEPWPWMVGTGIVALGLSAPARLFSSAADRLSPGLNRAWAVLGYGWMGVGFLLLVTLAASDLLLAIGTRIGGGLGDIDPSRLSAWQARVVVSVVAIVTVFGARAALKTPAVRRLRVPLSRWPRELEGFRIVQLSDIHIGPVLDRRFLQRVVDRCNELEPDLVVITGDVVDGSASRYAAEVAPLADLKARHGVHLVTGNHDHYSNASEWVPVFESHGVDCLRNASTTIATDSHAFTLAGIDDTSSLPAERTREFIAAALDGAPGDRATLLLAHSPNAFVEAVRAGVDLQLSGHTHGGQIWPFAYLVGLAHAHVAGLFRAPDGQAAIYVSRGTGFWGPPLRVAAPSEITELTLMPDGDRA